MSPEPETKPPPPSTPHRPPRVILLHGFNVCDEGQRSVGRLAPYFTQAGFVVKRPRYGWLGLLGVRLMNRRFARLIADMSEPGDIVVAHSNGCAIAFQAATEFHAEFAQLVFINPALDADCEFPPQISHVHIWHSPGDSPVAWSKLLPWHAWGDMGAVGYRGRPTPRVHCYDKQNDFPVSSRSHSDIFEPENLSYFAPIVLSQVLKYIP